MFERLGRFTVARRRAIVVATIAVAVTAGIVGGGVSKKLSSGGFDNPSSQSSRAAALLEAEFGQRQPNLVLLVTAAHGSVDDPAVAAAGKALTARLAAERGVTSVVSYWSLGGAAPLRSHDGTQALVLGAIPGTDNAVARRIEYISPRYSTADSNTKVAVTGFAEVYRQVNRQVESDLVRAESLAFPLTLVLLVLVFGSVVASLLPLAVGGIAIVTTLLMLWIVASLTEVSIFALNLTTMMGLGLAIDYSLFVVSRYREELRRGRVPSDAIVRTVATAGRTVAFSAFTLAISLAALLVFPLAFLRSFAYAGIAVALLAALAATVFLPALLALLGPRVEALRVRRPPDTATENGFWHRMASTVMRRPVPIATAVIALLVVLGGPFLHIELGLPDDRVLPKHLSSRAAQDDIRANFGSSEAGALEVVARDPNTAVGDATIDQYARSLMALDGVARVDTRTGVYTKDGVARSTDLPPGSLHDTVAAVEERFRSHGGTWLSVVPSVEPLSPAGERLTEAVRAAPAPFPVLVGGSGARLVDAKASLYGRLPLALGMIAFASFVLLFAMFGSIVVPLKALALNVLSLSATFGALVWIFQDGHLSGLLSFTPTGTIAVTMPILMFCMAFGLSMDYEVFLLSRIKEEHDRTGDNTASVAAGLERTGGIVSAAAVLISVVFLAFATSGVTFIKMFGIGLTLAVLMDAFVIRGTLVPAFMRLAGEANWWAPRPLRRLHDRFGIREVLDLDDDDDDTTPPPGPRVLAEVP